MSLHAPSLRSSQSSKRVPSSAFYISPSYLADVNVSRRDRRQRKERKAILAIKACGTGTKVGDPHPFPSTVVTGASADKMLH